MLNRVFFIFSSGARNGGGSEGNGDASRSEVAKTPAGGIELDFHVESLLGILNQANMEPEQVGVGIWLWKLALGLSFMVFGIVWGVFRSF